MKAIVSVIGKDKMGIIAKVSNFLYELNINIEDISQTIMQDYFTMIMLVDIAKSDIQLATLAKMFTQKGEQIGVELRIQHEDIFNIMHKL